MAAPGSMPSDTNQNKQNPVDENHTHTLMVPIVKHAANLGSEIDTADADPEIWRYHSGETIRYQLQQRPTAKTRSSVEWQQIFHPFSTAELTTVARGDLDDPPGSDPVNILSWTVPRPADLNGAHVYYDEFGYDEAGYLRKLHVPQQEEGEDTAANTTSGPPASGVGEKRGRVINEYMSTLSTPDAGPIRQRFGREWKFSLNGMSDDVLFSIAAAQLCQDTDLDDKRPRNLLGSARRRLTKLFLAQFRDKWEPSRQLWGASDYAWTGSVEFDKSSWKDVIFQYHMRVFTSWPHTRKWERLLGGGLKRDSGTINADNTQKKTPKTVIEVPDPKLKLGIYEMRYSIALKTTWGLDFPVFTLVTMADAAAGSLQKNSRNNMNLGERNAWETAGICPLIRTTGVAALAFRIQSLLPQWEAHWSRLVDDIGKLLNANLGSILSSTRRREIMVDTADLSLSELYFTVIQILRISADWIQESMDDLGHMVDDMERLYLSPGGATTEDKFATFCSGSDENRDAAVATKALFRKNWESVISQQQRLGNALLARIAKKMDETKSLRDGLFNATSVSQATKSTQLNHYIMVFTVATVFYLPLSFITALFALDLFNWEDPKQTTWFIITTVLVAGLTYLISSLSVWLVGNPAKRQDFVNWFARRLPPPKEASRVHHYGKKGGEA